MIKKDKRKKSKAKGSAIRLPNKRRLVEEKFGESSRESGPQWSGTHFSTKRSESTWSLWCKNGDYIGSSQTTPLLPRHWSATTNCHSIVHSPWFRVSKRLNYPFLATPPLLKSTGQTCPVPHSPSNPLPLSPNIIKTNFFFFFFKINVTLKCILQNGPSFF